MKELTKEERLARRLAGVALCDLRTARRFVAGEPMKPAVRIKLEEAYDSLPAEEKTLDK